MTLSEKENAAVLLKNTTVTPFIYLSFPVSFKCFYCAETSSDITHLLEHTKSHSVPEVKVLIKNYLKKGKKSFKADISDLMCRICNESLLTVDNARNHLETVHDESFTEAGNGIIPFRLKTVNGVYNCHACLDSFHSFPLLNKHNNLHYSNAICDTCGKHFATHPLLLQHKDTHITGQIPCKECSKTFNSPSKLRYHVNRVHCVSSKVKPSKCHLCESRFEYHYDKVKHLREVHDIIQSHPCQVCGIVFNTHKSLYFHSRKHHTLDVSCDICNRPFAERAHLRKHMVVHTQARNHKCTLCPKTYKYEKNLKDHMRVHNPDWKFACAHCLVGFRSKIDYRKHMLTHDALNQASVRTLIEANNTDKFSDKGAKLVCTRDSDKEPRIVLVYQTPQRRNAELILRHSTAYPFKTRFSQILCVHCHAEYALPELRYHMQSEHVNADFKNVFYRMKGNLIKVDVSDLGCKLCCESMPDLDTLMRHFSQQHGLPVKLNTCYGVLPYRLRDSRWLCVRCERTYDGFVDYKRHVASHYMDYNCDRCGTAFVSLHALRDHQRQVKCSRVTYKPRNGRFTRHRGNAEIILRCSTAYPFRTWMSNINCVFCTTKTRDPIAFRDHMAMQHAVFDVQAAFYKKLGKAFLSVDITDLRCKICSQLIESFDQLIDHLKKEHHQPFTADAQPGVLPFRLGDGTVWRCAICTDRFKDLLSLKKHTHGHFQNYVCDACGEGFITESAMVAHSRTPHENKYNCSRCVATFRSLVDRDLHVKSQHTSTPYVCSYCQDKPRFSSWEARKRHLLEVHNYGSSVDGYECSLCRKRFKSRSGKYNHVARVHRAVKDTGAGYTCASCSRAFTSQLFLDKHIAKKHENV